MKRQFLFAWFAVLGLVLASASFAIEGGEPHSLESRTLSKLHHVNQMEIQMGQLAVARTAREDVRAYGQRLIDDHTAADRQIFDLASRENIRLFNWAPETQEEQLEMQQQHDLMARLGTLQGVEFDREFLPAMVSGHEKVLAELNGRLAQLTLNVRTFIEGLLPTIQAHRDEAKRLSEIP